VPKVSIIVVNFNGRHFLTDLLTSLHAQTYSDFEVIIVDNASVDGSAEYLREHHGWVRLLELRTNVGFAEGNNVGARVAKGQYLALLNPDTVVDHRWLEELVCAIDSDQSIGAAVSKIYIADRNCVLDCAGAEFNNIGYFWGRGSNEIDRGQYDVAMDVSGATACSMILRREFAKGTPLFDGSFFGYYEEFELSLRILGRGYRIRYAPKSVVFHKRSGIVRKHARNPLLYQQWFSNRNRLKILAKYYPVSVLARNLPLIFLSLVYWDSVFLLRGSPRFFLRAVAGQAQYAAHGLVERVRGGGVDPQAWLPWMMYSGLVAIMKVRFQRRYTH
jgi:GT2 family glycosyltransferase